MAENATALRGGKDPLGAVGGHEMRLEIFARSHIMLSCGAEANKGPCSVGMSVWGCLPGGCLKKFASRVTSPM